MAASFTRADPTSPSSIADAKFSTARKGYSPDEVRGFLAAVSTELRRAQERERELVAELHEVQARGHSGGDLDDETAAKLLGEETLRVLHTARESASEIKIRAEEQAARIMRDAHDEVNRLRQEAEVEAARRRQDATSDAEAEVALAKQQGREMVNEARAYRERVLADLDRRTNLARKQIEELVHGRDRLLQVFERARLVAVDVTSNLQAIEGPDELVNLSPTTGPVPLMVPTGADPIADPSDRTAPDTSSDAADDDASGDGADDDASVDGAAAEHGEGPGDDAAEPAAVDDETGDDTGDVSDGDANAADADGAEVVEVEAGDLDDDGHDDEAPDAASRDAVDDAVDADADADVSDSDDVDDHQVDDRQVDDDAHDGAADGDGTNGNVVSLFPDDADGDRPATSDAVDGIFAKLRAADAATAVAIVEDVETDEGAADTPFARRDEALVPLTLAAARRIKRVLADEQNGVLDALRRGDAISGIEALVGDPAEQHQRYLTALDEQLGAAAASGAEELGATDTTSLRATLSGAGALDGAVEIVTGSIVEPLRQRLAAAVADADGDHDELTQAVRAIYREWKTQQIDAHLDDVMRAAYAGAIAAGIEPGSATVWACDPTATACPDCEDNSLAGEVTIGEPFPTGHQAAPAHAGCRCLTLPAPR